MTIEVMTLEQAKCALDVKAIDELRSRVRGQVLTATEVGYVAARRIWNSMIDKRPFPVRSPFRLATESL